MGRYATRFIFNLSEDDRKWLESVWKSDLAHSKRCRAHTILSSFRRRTVNELALIMQVTPETIHDWLDRWEERGRDGLDDAPRSGRPPTLDQTDEQTLKKLILKHPQEPRVVQRELELWTGKTLSRSTLRRVARKIGLSWRRLRRSLRKNRDQKAFQAAMEELDVFRKESGVNVVYFDEAGFSLTAVVGYAWQPRGQRTLIPISGGSRQSIQVLGFQSQDGSVHAYLHRGTVNGKTVIDVIDDYAKQITGSTILVLDNASPHTCKALERKRPEWEKLGLTLYYLPPYSPELNRIEHLWQHVKYQMLPTGSWESLGTLKSNLVDALESLGSVFELPSIQAV